MVVDTVCTCCKVSSEAHKIIPCAICKKSYLHTCVDLTSSEVRTIKSKKGLSWTCRTCLSVGNDINELKAIIIALKNEVAELKNHRKGKDEVNGRAFEEIIQEVSERQKRKQNLIIYGVEEPRNENPKISTEQDKQKVADLLSFLSVPAGSITPIRLGQPPDNSAKTRPIKIVLQSESNVHIAVKNAKKLKTSDSFKNISVSLDRTPRQIAYYRNVKADLDDRKSKGEENLIIKYVGGVPTITALN